MNPIYVDDRVGAVELAKHIGPKASVQRLEYGDAMFLGEGDAGAPLSIGIERKRVLDLVNSMVTGRLSGHQLIGLKSSYDYVYLLVEGLWKADSQGMLVKWGRRSWVPVELGKRRFMAKEVEKFLNTLAIMCGVVVWRTESEEQSGRWLRDLHEWWQRPWNKHKSHLAFHTPTPTNRVSLIKPKLVHRVAKELAGVGWDKGKALADKFTGVGDLVSASEKELAKVPGIGKKLAKSIREELNGDNDS